MPAVSFNGQLKIRHQKLAEELCMQRILRELSTKVLSVFFNFNFITFRAWTLARGENQPFLLCDPLVPEEWTV
jgi:hypothetical protein